MDFDGLQVLARKAANKITASNPIISQWRPSPFPEDVECSDLAAIVEKLDISRLERDRLQVEIF